MAPSDRRALSGSPREARRKTRPWFCLAPASDQCDINVGLVIEDKHTTCRSAKNKFPQPGMPVPAHDNEIGTCIGCI